MCTLFATRCNLDQSRLRPKLSFLYLLLRIAVYIGHLRMVFIFGYCPDNARLQCTHAEQYQLQLQHCPIVRNYMEHVRTCTCLHGCTADMYMFTTCSAHHLWKRHETMCFTVHTEVRSKYLRFGMDTHTHTHTHTHTLLCNKATTVKQIFYHWFHHGLKINNHWNINQNILDIECSIVGTIIIIVHVHYYSVHVHYSSCTKQYYSLLVLIMNTKVNINVKRDCYTWFHNNHYSPNPQELLLKHCRWYPSQ